MIQTAFPAILASALDETPKAAAFIVTIYGDIVDPRGGVLWMGNLIEICSWFGISESLTRTAVSRLVSAGQLAGERVGRRSFYRLTDRARAEYLQAAGILFHRREPQSGFFIALNVPADQDRTLRGQGFVPVSTGVWIGTAQPGEELPGVVFAAKALSGTPAVAALASGAWPLDDYRVKYQSFIERYSRIESTLPEDGGLRPADALALRLAMVHAYRAVVLKDPHLPPNALPPDWPAPLARALFNRLYLRMTAAAEVYITGNLLAVDGPLSAETAASKKRLQGLRSF